MRKALLWTTGIIIALVLLLLILPFLIDLNKFKPQIQAAVSEKVNAKLDFDSARLTILTGLGVKLEKVSIENTDPTFKGTKLFSVNEVVFRTELMPLLKKQFVGEVRIDSPSIEVMKAGLKNNLASLAKEESKATPSQPISTPTPAPGSGLSTEKANELKNNVLIKSFKLQNATIKVGDLLTHKNSLQLRDLNIVISNIGAERDVKTEISTNIDVNDKGIRVSGPIKFDLNTFVNLSGFNFQKATFKGALSLNDLDINAMNAFVKKPGVPLNLSFAGVATPNSMEIKPFDFHLQDLLVAGQVNVADLKTLNTDLLLKAEDKDLIKLGELLPQHKKLLMNGSLLFETTVKGPLSDLGKVQAKVALDTKLTGSDLSVRVNADNLLLPKVQITARSGRLDAGALLKPFMPPESKKAETTAVATTAPANPQSAASTSSAPPGKDFELTAEQRKMLQNADIDVDVTMNEILYDKLKISHLVLNMAQKGLLLNLNRFGLEAFGGYVTYAGKVDLASSPIGFNGKLDLKNIRTEEAIAFVKPEYKDVLESKASIDLGFQGRGTTVPTLNKTLNGKGSFLIADGKLNTKSIAATAQDELQKQMANLSVTKSADDIFKGADKFIQGDMGKKLGLQGKVDVAKYKQEFEKVKGLKIAEKGSTTRNLKNLGGTIEIKNGRIYITSKDSITEGDYNFNSSVGLDMSLGGTATFIASNATKQKLLTQSKYASLLFDEKGNFIVDMKLGGTVKSPSVNIDFAPISARFTKNARDLLEKEVKKQGEDLLKQALKGKAKDALSKMSNENKDKAKKELNKATDKAKEQLKGLFK